MKPAEQKHAFSQLTWDSASCLGVKKIGPRMGPSRFSVLLAANMVATALWPCMFTYKKIQSGLTMLV